MKIQGARALVTGANRGIGAHLARQLRDRGATVYAGARDPELITDTGITPVRIDITDPTSIAAAVADIGPITILVNNAGSSTGASLLDGDLAEIRTEIETHYFGTLSMIRAFAPGMADAPESAILNVLSVLSWLAFPQVGAYCAAKSASWAMTNALRQELAGQGTRVSGLHVGYVDTDMTAGLDVAKTDPAAVAVAALDGIEAGDYEIVVDELSEMVRNSLGGGVGALYPGFASSTAS